MESLYRGLVHQLRRELNDMMTAQNHTRLYITVGYTVWDALAYALNCPREEVYWFKAVPVGKDGTIHPLDFIIEEWSF